MSKKKAGAMITQDKFNLEQPPHVLSILIGLVRGEAHPNPSKQEQIVSHLVECVLCQGALKTLLAIELERDRQIGITGEPARRLISRLTEIFEETQIRQDIPAYVEAIDFWGEEEARKRYPRLAEHLQNCKSCQLQVKGIQTLKREAEEASMITPLIADKGG